MEIDSLQRNNPDMLLLSPMFFALVLMVIAVIDKMVMAIRMMLVMMVMVIMAIETTMMLASSIAKVVQPGWREKKTWRPVAGLTLPIREPGLQQILRSMKNTSRHFVL